MIKKIYHITSILLWIFFVVWIGTWLILKFTSDGCNEDIYNKSDSMDGSLTAEIIVKDCGGATTDFFSFVRVLDNTNNDVIDRVFNLRGKISESDIELKWIENKKLEISINDLNSIASYEPKKLKSKGLEVQLTYLKSM